jgi:glutathione S-transferase
MIIKDTHMTRNGAGKIITDKPTLWHCHNSRSLRPLWTLAEMGMDYDLVEMQFPPRATQAHYKQMNVLGTVPYFIDGETHMTESSAICQYLVERYGHDSLRIAVSHAEYGDYLNWLFMSYATLLFPQTIVLRYSKLEVPTAATAKVVEDYRVWFLARLKKLNQHLPGREFLCGNRFTIADIAVGFSLYFGESQGMAGDYSPQVLAYLARLKARSALQAVADVAEQLSPFLHPELILS